MMRFERRDEKNAKEVIFSFPTLLFYFQKSFWSLINICKF